MTSYNPIKGYRCTDVDLGEHIGCFHTEHFEAVLHRSSMPLFREGYPYPVDIAIEPARFYHCIAPYPGHLS